MPKNAKDYQTLRNVVSDWDDSEKEGGATGTISADAEQGKMQDTQIDTTSKDVCA